MLTKWKNFLLGKKTVKTDAGLLLVRKFYADHFLHKAMAWKWVEHKSYKLEKLKNITLKKIVKI